MLALTRKPMSTRDAVHPARLCYAPSRTHRGYDETPALTSMGQLEELERRPEPHVRATAAGHGRSDARTTQRAGPLTNRPAPRQHIECLRHRCRGSKRDNCLHGCFSPEVRRHGPDPRPTRAANCNGPRVLLTY